MFALALHWARSLGQRFFLQFGLHCATHQIRVILISSVVITSLFYPALDLYTSSRDASQSILDGFISPRTAAALKSENDIVNVWAGQDTLRVHQDPFTRAKCNPGHALRIERIFVQTALLDDDGALDHKILLSTLKFESRLQKLIDNGHTPCLKNPAGNCLVISPLAFWNYNEKALLSTASILDSLSYSNNISIHGIPVTPSMVLAGRGSYEPPVGGNKFDYATFLALTYFFPNSECWDSSLERTHWLQTVKNAAGRNAETVEIPEATLLALEYDPHRSESPTKGWSAISALLYLPYISFLAYVAWSVKRMDAVHSRLGVTFTALVEIAVSTITSLSVCALVGFKITMVPWEILPIVIVFVGAENMFNLVDAVGKTSVTLPVKMRIAEGLSRAGTSNTLKVVSYNTILGIIAVFGVGAVRQFCVFAIVVLVAHWFLAHTFFMAVLSIDIARLELEELLRKDTSLTPSASLSRKNTQSSQQPLSKWQKLIFSIQALLKGRAATNISLLVLLTIAATLYYMTYTSVVDPSFPKPLRAVSRTRERTSSDALVSTAEHIWKTLNPAQASLLHLRIELPTIITLGLDGDDASSTLSAAQTSYRSRYTMRTFKFVLWLLTIMVLPIAATTSALWGLLIYLLKNTELLEAQRHHPNADFASQGEDKSSLQGQISFSTLPRAFASDVELIAASKDGNTVVSVGLHNEIIVWNSRTKKHVAINAECELLKIASTSSYSTTVTSVTVDDTGSYFAVGTGAGHIAAWVIDKYTGHIRPLPALSLENSYAGVTEMKFVPPIRRRDKSKPRRTPSAPDLKSPEPKKSDGAILLATYESGLSVRWTVGDSPTVAYFSPPLRAAVVRASLLHVIPDDRVLIAFCLDDGTVELIETGDYEPMMLNDCNIQPGNPFDVVVKVHACRAVVNGSMRLVVAAATEAGLVSLWDGLTGECISLFEEAHGQISTLRVSPVQCEKCHFCGHLPMESLSVAFSVDHVIRFSKLYISDQTRRCSCSQAHDQQKQKLRRVSSRESVGKRSRSNSNASSSQLGSPLTPRARLATAFETSAFPVSGHGVHSRRADKDSTRRSFELLPVPFPGNLNGEDYDFNISLTHPREPSGSTTPTSTGGALQSIWRRAVMVPLADVTCERGGWDVTSKAFVGIRRKPRSVVSKLHQATSTLASSSCADLTSATLERWELWTFDPALALLRSSLLTALALCPPLEGGAAMANEPCSSQFTTTTSAKGERIARLPFTRVSPLLIANSHALAGFGNTVGVFHFEASI